MASTLAEKVSSDVSAVLIRTEHFAEWGTYLPKSGASRRVKLVAQSQAKRIQDDPHHKTEANEVTFLVSTSRTEGIPDPQLGDALRLDSDGPDQIHDFSQIIDNGPGFVLVKFIRKKILRSGQFRPSSL